MNSGSAARLPQIAWYRATQTRLDIQRRRGLVKHGGDCSAGHGGRTLCLRAEPWRDPERDPPHRNDWAAGVVSADAAGARPILAQRGPTASSQPGGRRPVRLTDCRAGLPKGARLALS
jgi:hypothetical protein